MRNWNIFEDDTKRLPGIVFILPMRNWNAEESGEYNGQDERFHSTYEELKHNFLLCKYFLSQRFHSTYEELKHQNQRSRRDCLEQFSFYLWGIETSHMMPAHTYCCIRFSFYLWGIETISPCQQYLFVQQVFILPMRNWNKKLQKQFLLALFCFHSTSEELKPLSPKNGCLLSGVFILPMRNWNIGFQLLGWILSNSFHSTYEELKQIEKDKRTG